MQNFEFFVGGIEDGIIELLNQLYGFRDGNPNGYLKDVGSYGGQLDEKVLTAYIDELTPMFPLMLVAYGDGADKLDPATSPAYGEPRIWKHDCTFSVICCDDNARGEKERRRGDAGMPGVIKMISDTRDALAGRQFKKDGELLTFEPIRLAGVEFIARLPQLTAYVQHFDTFFRWTEPDRRGETHDVEELIFTAGSTGGTKPPGTLPGVEIK
jgi:uncharacterized protein DUF1834